MSLLNNRVNFLVALLFASAAVAASAPAVWADETEAPKVSTFAPAKDLVSQADDYVKSLQKIVATEADYKDGESKIAKDANTLIIIALALGMHDEDNKYKASAGALMKAAQAMADAKDYASAKKAAADVKAAAEGKLKADAALKWEKVASLPELMKQVPLINTKLKMKVKGKKFAKNADETAGYTAVLAAIAQGAMADTSVAKNDEQAKQWKEFCASARDAAAAVNAAIHKGDQEACDKAMEELNLDCEKCHAVFKPEEVK